MTHARKRMALLLKQLIDGKKVLHFALDHKKSHQAFRSFIDSLTDDVNPHVTINFNNLTVSLGDGRVEFRHSTGSVCGREYHIALFDEILSDDDMTALIKSRVRL